MVRFGLPGDPRKFKRTVPKSKRERDVKRKAHMEQKRCSVCGLVITGKYWRVDDRHVACFRCNNEQPGV
jgi:formylmethanofuran dehydrogenase subunit E